MTTGAPEAKVQPFLLKTLLTKAPTTMIDSDNNDDDKTINIKVKTVIVRQKKKVLTSVLF